MEIKSYNKVALLIIALGLSFPSIASPNLVDLMMTSSINNQSTINSRQLEKKQSAHKERSLLEKALHDKNLKPVVEYIYDKKTTYKLRLSTYITTNIILPDDEKIVKFNFGDSSNFSGSHSKKIPNILSLNTLENDLYTNLTIITENQKIYNFTLFSINDEKWRTPHFTVYIKKNQKELNKIRFENLRKSNPEVKNIKDTKNLNFDYKVKTKGFFISDEERAMIPKEIYDDGKFTYIHLSNSTRLPTIYEIVDGFDEVVNYKIHKNLAVIETVSSHGFSLKNGDITICIRKEDDI